jgi:hypothetical protein
MTMTVMIIIIISSVGKRLRYGLDDRGIEVRLLVRYFSLVETTQNPTQWGPAPPSWGLRDRSVKLTTNLYL